MKCNGTYLRALDGFTDVDFSSKRNLSFSMEDKRGRGGRQMEAEEGSEGNGLTEEEEEGMKRVE